VKAYKGVGVQLHAFLARVPERGGWSDSLSAAFLPMKEPLLLQGRKEFGGGSSKTSAAARGKSLI
jgi:hypothetical protein